MSPADDLTPVGPPSDDEFSDDEFVEDLAPDPTDREYFTMSPAKAFRLTKARDYNKDEHDAVTRRIIAFWVLTIVSVLYLLAVVGMICHWINVEELGRIALVLGPIQALAAAVLGFYFGRQHSS